MKKVFVLAVTVSLVLSILSGTAYALSDGDIIGTWRLESLVLENQIYTPEETGIQATIVLNAEGKAVLITSSDEPKFASWRISGDTVMFKSDTDDIPFSYTGGKLIAEADGVSMTFNRVSDRTEIVEDSPVKTDAVIDDFTGAWTAVYIEVNGFFVKLTDVGAEMTLKITESTVESRERATGNDEVVNTASCAMNGYSLQISNKDGSTQLLKIHEKGMIELPLTTYTVWLTNDNIIIKVTPSPIVTPEPIITLEPIVTPQPINEQWTCASCGQEGNTGKFCTECGEQKQTVAPGGWTCSCGTVNEGKFCFECGLPKPSDTPAIYKCSNCGWDPEDPETPPKFCPDCGDAFDENDIIG